MLNRLSSFSGPFSKTFRIGGLFTLNGLILRYEMSDGDSYYGTTTVSDLVSNSNATLNNSPAYSSNGYINFDGVNEYLITNTSLNSKLVPVNTSTVISYFTWIYPQDNGVIISEQGTTTLDNNWYDSQVEIVSGSLKFRVWPGGALTSLISISFYNWYYVGFTYDGAILRGYVNGQFAGSYNINRQTPWNNNQGHVGTGLFYTLAAGTSTNLGDGTYAKMKFGAFHVYNKVLSNQEVINNYNVTRSNYIYTGTMSIWIDANDAQSYPGSGTTVTDMSGNNYTHSLVGSTYKNLYGIQCFDCTTGTNRVVVNGTGPTLPTTGYTYITWARLEPGNPLSFRTLIYTNSPKYTPITIPNGTNTLGYWDTAFRSSGYGLTSSISTWVQYAVVGDDSSQTFYINDTKVGDSISFGSGGRTHWGLGNNDTATQPWGYVANMMLYNTKLTQEQIKQNYDALKHVYEQSNFVTDNLILYLNPDNLLSYSGSGSTINDLSGNSLNGSLSNVTFSKKYLTFNGSSSTFTVPDNSILEPGSGDFTVEVWINHSVISGGSRCILSKTDGGLSSEWAYGLRTLSSGSTYLEVGNGVTSTTSPSYTLTVGNWYQVVGVFKNVGSNSVELYVNGISQGSNSHSFSSIKNTTHSLSIGSFDAGIGGFGQYVNGKIGIVRLYNSALSSSDVSKNFEINRSIYGI